MKLNLGCGDHILEGYVNCDLYNKNADLACDIRKLPFEDNSIDEIISLHVIEHFDWIECKSVLKEWHRVLKPNGLLILETPDLLETCKKFCDVSEEERFNMYGHIFAKPWIDGEIHKFLFTKNEIAKSLTEAGFTDITFTEPTRYTHQPNLRVEAKK